LGTVPGKTKVEEIETAKSGLVYFLSFSGMGDGVSNHHQIDLSFLGFL
jgi:hypothetical protein